MQTTPNWMASRRQQLLIKQLLKSGATLVDSATDSNVFTDADHSKLDRIEGRRHTDTANVTAAGALMDRRLQTLHKLKRLIRPTTPQAIARHHR